MTTHDRWIGTCGLWILGAVLLTINAGGFGWVGLWGFWIYFPASAALMFWATRHDWLAAGATWVQSGKSWVSTYKLRRIRFGVDGYNRVLRLDDEAGHRIYSLKLRDVQSNPAMWDLVYNGILHSVASGNCDISEKARKEIRIPLDLGRDKR